MSGSRAELLVNCFFRYASQGKYDVSDGPGEGRHDITTVRGGTPLGYLRSVNTTGRVVTKRTLYLRASRPDY